MVEQDPPGLGEPHPVAAAFEECAAKFPFEFGELLGERGRGEGQAFRGRGNGPRACHFHEDSQSVRVEHHTPMRQEILNLL